MDGYESKKRVSLKADLSTIAPLDDIPGSLSINKLDCCLLPVGSFSNHGDRSGQGLDRTLSERGINSVVSKPMCLQ